MTVLLVSKSKCEKSLYIIKHSENNHALGYKLAGLSGLDRRPESFIQQIFIECFYVACAEHIAVTTVSAFLELIFELGEMVNRHTNRKCYV